MAFEQQVANDPPEHRVHAATVDGSNETRVKINERQHAWRAWLSFG